MAKYEKLEALAGDKFTYLPCLVPSLLVSAGLLRLLASWPGERKVRHKAAVVFGTTLACLAALAFLGWRQSERWKTPARVWEYAVSINPDCIQCRKALGFIYIDEGRYQDSITHDLEFLRVKPSGDAEILLNLCRAFGALGRMEEAASYLHRANNLNPAYLAWYGRQYLSKALELAQRGRWDEAIVQMRIAMALDSSLGAVGHYNLGYFLQMKGQTAEAEKEYEAALTLNPAMANAHLNLGVILTAQKRISEAVRHCRKARELSPGMSSNPFCRGS